MAGKKQLRKNFKLCEIPGSHGGEHEDDCLLDVAPCSLVELDSPANFSEKHFK